MKLDVRANVLEANDKIAARLRQEWRGRRTVVINLISSPGSGKTTLLEHTLARLQSRLRVAVLVGDVQTDNDARRLAPFGFPVRQIVTAGDCHLEAHLVERHLQFVEAAGGLDLLFIENVGNLVCPTDYDLGEDAKVVLLSTTEGEDKPLKYPAIFHRATAALLTKTDLLPHLDFSLELVRHNLRTVHPGVPLFEVSARTGVGLEAWLDWLFLQVRAKCSGNTVTGGDRHVRGRAG